MLVSKFSLSRGVFEVLPPFIMATEVTTSPFIANIIELFIILCLILTISYSISYYTNLHKPTSIFYFLSPKNPRRIKFYKEPIYSDRKELVPYKNLFCHPTCMLSIVIPVMNCGEKILNSFETIYSYFNSRFEQNNENTFEILIVDNHSNLESRNIYFSFARKYQNVSVLVLNDRKTTGEVVAAGLLHAEGHELFLFFPVSRFPLSEIDNLLEKAQQMGQRHVIIPTLQISDSLQNLFSSTLFQFIFWINDFLLGTFDLAGFAPFKVNAMLISREAALEIMPSLASGPEFNEEIVILSALSRIPIDTVDIQKLEPVSTIKYLDIVYYLITLIKLSILYHTHLRRLYQIKIPSRSKKEN